MPEPLPQRRAAVAHARKPSRRRRYWVIGAGAFVIVLIGCVAWVGLRALTAKSELESALPMVTTLKTQIVAQDVKGAKATLAKLRPKVDSARDLTSDPIWQAGEIVPFVGPNLHAAHG